MKGTVAKTGALCLIWKVLLLKAQFWDLLANLLGIVSVKLILVSAKISLRNLFVESLYVTCSSFPFLEDISVFTFLIVWIYYKDVYKKS